jgi:hypothetical protein
MSLRLVEPIEQVASPPGAFTDLELFSWLASRVNVRAPPLRLLVVLVREAADNGYAARGHAVYASQVGCSLRTIANHLRQLEGVGAIKCFRRAHQHIYVKWARLALVHPA